MKTIAILGATGYLGKSLSRELSVQKEAANLYLFSRSQEKALKLKEEVPELGSQENNYFYSLDKLSSFDYDVIINCTGASDTVTKEGSSDAVIAVTESVDDMVMEYLKKKPNTLYINISSGAIYNTPGAGMSSMTTADYYAFAKKDAEKKHRSLIQYSIVDVRVFSFFSRFVDTQRHSLMSGVIDSLTNKKIFVTHDGATRRDYLSPHDLCALIWCIIQKGKQNDAYDAYSLEPVSISKLLEFLHTKYELQYEIVPDAEKKIYSQDSYLPRNKKAESIGYSPELASVESIDHELRALLKQ